MENKRQHFSEQRSPWLFLIMTVIAAFPLLVRLFNHAVPQHWPTESMAELERIRNELPLAEARWKAHNITDYEIDAYAASQHTTFCGVFEKGEIYFEPHHLKVQGAEIVFANESQKSTVDECNIDSLLPPKVFDFIRRTLEDADPKSEYLSVEFDPEYGFVSEYLLTSNYRARLSPYAQYSMSNFRPAKP